AFSGEPAHGLPFPHPLPVAAGGTLRHRTPGTASPERCSRGQYPSGGVSLRRTDPVGGDPAEQGTRRTDRTGELTRACLCRRCCRGSVHLCPTQEVDVPLPGARRRR